MLHTTAGLSLCCYFEEPLLSAVRQSTQKPCHVQEDIGCGSGSERGTLHGTNVEKKEEEEENTMIGRSQVQSAINNHHQGSRSGWYVSIPIGGGCGGWRLIDGPREWWTLEMRPAESPMQSYFYRLLAMHALIDNQSSFPLGNQQQ